MLGNSGPIALVGDLVEKRLPNMEFPADIASAEVFVQMCHDIIVDPDRKLLAADRDHTLHA